MHDLSLFRRCMNNRNPIISMLHLSFDNCARVYANVLAPRANAGGSGASALRQFARGLSQSAALVDAAVGYAGDNS